MTTFSIFILGLIFDDTGNKVGIMQLVNKDNNEQINEADEVLTLKCFCKCLRRL